MPPIRIRSLTLNEVQPVRRQNGICIVDGLLRNRGRRHGNVTGFRQLNSSQLHDTDRDIALYC